MKRLALSGLLVVHCCLAVSPNTSETISCNSPDGKFALRCVSANQQPYNGDTAIIDLATHKTVRVLDPEWILNAVKLVWSPDSQRVAYYSRKEKDSGTRVFLRHDSSLEEAALPDSPSPKLPAIATAGSDANTSTRIEPMSWSGPRDLQIEKELVNPDWGRAALKITIGFDQNDKLSIRSSEQERVSIIDDFLLLPAKDFEAPLEAWLRSMRTDAAFMLCETKPQRNVDEKNGYMNCPGDGAQPEFEVALFRYRDGRPLLALCSGELEGADAVALQFFELRTDGKMQKYPRPILPATDIRFDPEIGYEKMVTDSIYRERAKRL